MSSFEVVGGKKLSGTIYPQGAKNEALQITVSYTHLRAHETN